MKASDANGNRMTVGRTARLADVGIPTMRFYERAGLLPKPRRSAEVSYEKNVAVLHLAKRSLPRIDEVLARIKNAGYGGSVIGLP